MSKALQLLALALRSRREFMDRVRAIVEVRSESLWRAKPIYRATDLEGIVSQLQAATGKDLAPFMNEPAAAAVAASVQARMSAALQGPFKTIHNADFDLARTCYAVCRAYRPAIVVETGVAYGVTSAFVLAALKENDAGHLHSVDLPPLGTNADSYVGALIPEDLRRRWSLHRGASRRVLPELLRNVKKVDIFIHDSLHTYANMRYEFAAVTPYLAAPGVVIADDISENDAFGKWCRASPLTFHAVAAEPQKQGNVFGIAVTTA